jgi:hypothetical protein
MPEKICPFLSFRAKGEEDSTTPCYREACELWDSESLECAVKSIRALFDVADALKDVPRSNSRGSPK